MNATNTFKKNSKNKKERNDDLSKNHQFKVKYRVRKQQEEEADKELREYDGQAKSN